MKRNNFIKFFITGVFALASTPIYAAFDWCTFAGLNCPPPAQSVDINVPRAVPLNAKGRASNAQAIQFINYLNTNFVAQATVPFVPPVFGQTDLGPVKYKGDTYYYYHVQYGNITVNVGLIIAKFQSFASNPQYVLNNIANEVGTTVVTQ